MGEDQNKLSGTCNKTCKKEKKNKNKKKIELPCCPEQATNTF